jgi:hypothetical protein
MKQMTFNDATYLNYMQSNNIKYISSADLCGCFILKEIAILPGSDENFILEQFNGCKVMVSENKVRNKLMIQDTVCKHDTSLRSFKIVNIAYDELYSYHIKDHYNRANYCPTYNSILSYIRKEWRIFNYDANIDISIQVKATNLTKQQMESLKAKLSIIGTHWKLVDYNTIAVVRENGKIEIYTQQKKVIM